MYALYLGNEINHFLKKNPMCTNLGPSQEKWEDRVKKNAELSLLCLR